MMVSTGRNERGRVCFGLTSLNNFSGLWGIGAVSSCLVSDPGVIGAGL